MRSAVVLSILVVALSAVGSPVEAQDDSALERAYRKEFAFLEAEKNALQARIAQTEQEGEAKAAAGERQVQALAGQVMGATMQADTLSEQLRAAQQRSDLVAEGDDLLDATVAQASTALEKGGVELPRTAEGDSEARVKQLSSAFDGALSLLGKYGQVRTVPGAYFGSKGQKVEGKIVHIGQVAAYGVGPESGALAPAGGGELKILETATPAAVQSAMALLQGDRAPVLGIFLYESLEQAFEARKDKTPLQVVESGGVIAWVIVALGGVVLLMLLVRVAVLLRNSASSEKWVARLEPLVRARRYDEAAKLCEQSSTSPARVLGVTVRNLGRPREQLDDMVSEQIMAEAPVLDLFSQMVLVFAAIAPLLGLLGTVTGMISTFDIITEFGTGNPKLLSGGISEALITTELGLIVAIPALLGGNMLGAWGERIKTDMDRASLRLTNIAFGREPKASADEFAPEGGPALAPAE